MRCFSYGEFSISEQNLKTGRISHGGCQNPENVNHKPDDTAGIRRVFMNACLALASHIMSVNIFSSTEALYEEYPSLADYAAELGKPIT